MFVLRHHLKSIQTHFPQKAQGASVKFLPSLAARALLVVMPC